MFLISFLKSLISSHRLFQLLLLLAVLVAPVLSTRAATFTVTKTADTFDGGCSNANCSLRDAISAANSNGSGADTINFSASGTISPTSALPAILTSLTIDGGTNNTYPQIELNGTSAGANSDGLVVQTPIAGGPITVTIKNMIVNRFGRYGIFVNCYDGCNFTLLRTMLGTNNVGTVDLGNGQSGISAPMCPLLSTFRLSFKRLAI